MTVRTTLLFDLSLMRRVAVLILSSMRFRDRLLATLRDVQPILDVPGVMVGGSQVPNLLEPDAAATLVVSQDVDLVVPVGRHGE